MKKVSLFIFLFLMACVPVLAQKNADAQKPACELGLEQSPEMRGFRLGMTQAAALSRLPGITIEKPDKFGLARLRLSVIDSTSVVKTSRERAVEPDLIAGSAEGSAFVVDPVRFPALKGTRKIVLRFIDGRLAYLEVGYDNEIKWESIDQFVEAVSAKMKVATEWRVPAASDSGTEKELRCQGFVLTASTAGSASDVRGGPALILLDPAAWEGMSKRQNEVVEKQKKSEEDKRKAFKP